MSGSPNAQGYPPRSHILSRDAERGETSSQSPSMDNETMTSILEALKGNNRKARSPAPHRNGYHSRLVRLGCEMLEDRVVRSRPRSPTTSSWPLLSSQGLPSTTRTNSRGAFAETPVGATDRGVRNGSMQSPFSWPPRRSRSHRFHRRRSTWHGPVCPARTGYLVDEWINSALDPDRHAGSGSGSLAVKGLSYNISAPL